MTQARQLRRGSCLCGETAFEIHGALDNVVACHCTQCRKQTGHFLVSASASIADVRMLGDSRVTWYPSSEGARRAFCSRCGSTLFWQATSHPDRLSIALGLIDGPTGLVTEGHIFCADKGDYYAIPASEGFQRAGWE